MAGDGLADLSRGRSAENLRTTVLFEHRMVVVKEKGGRPDESRDIPAEGSAWGGMRHKKQRGFVTLGQEM